MSEFKPYLSVVVCSRNDNHGEGMKKRQQIFADSLIAQAEKHQIPMELVFVEWNPPVENPGIAEAMPWPPKSSFCQVKIVTVPNELHRRFKSSENLPLFQMIAKNVGIRYSSGEFILCTNVDVIFSDELCLHLKKKSLKKGVLYRNNRYDVDRNIPEFKDIEETLTYCRGNIVRKNMPDGTYLKNNGIWVHGNKISNEISVLHFALNALTQLMGKKCKLYKVLLKEIKIFKFNRIVEPKHILKPLTILISKFIYGAIMALYMCIGAIVTFPLVLRKKAIRSVWNRFANARTLKRCFTKYLQLNTNACGDFTLLDRESWCKLKGYWEFEGYSWHLDTLFLLQAYANGVKFKMLPDDGIIYHIDHGGGWSPEESAKLFSRLDEKGIPYLTERDLLRHEKKMHSNQLAGVFSLLNTGEEWGLGASRLEEYIVTKIENCKSTGAD